jgi:hypothetical protein
VTTPLEALEARCGPATFEEGSPWFVRVMVHGQPRRYPGKDRDAAIAQALAATTPRAAKEED